MSLRDSLTCPLTALCSVVSNPLQRMDCIPPGSTVHGIFQARILEWIAISYSRGSSQPRDQTMSPTFVGILFTTEHLGSPHALLNPLKLSPETTSIVKLWQTEVSLQQLLLFCWLKINHIYCPYFTKIGGFPGDPESKESASNVGDLSSISLLGRSLKNGMASYYSILALRIPRSEEPGRLQSMESQSWTWLSD